MKNKVLIYGAAGYMGKLFTQYALQVHIPLVLGGRKSMETTNEIRVFSIDRTENIVPHLHDIKLLVNLAGPFLHTQQSCIEACLKTGTHYIDISGEAPEFKFAFSFHERALKANIMILPGAGFGVVPTVIAAHLAHQKLPDATHLKIAYLTKGGVSRGTFLTVLKDIHQEGIEIVEGEETPAMPAQSDILITTDERRYKLVYNPWRGDLFAAFHSTRIPNIQTFSNFPRLVERMMHGKSLWLRDLIVKHLIRFLPQGPNKSTLTKGKTFILAEVKNKAGKTETVNIIGPDAYLFSAQTLTQISLEILNENWKAGFQTPSIYAKEILSSPYDNVRIV